MAFSLVIAGPGLLSAQTGAGQAGLRGTVIAQPVAASDFTLTDQTGSAFRMSTTRGKVVVLSFIYTHCADVCPYISVKLRSALSALGADAKGVVFVAITTDPKRDTLPVIARYSREMGLYDSWHFLTGGADEVKKVWSAYGVGVHVVTSADLDQSGSGDMSMMAMHHDEGLSSSDKQLVMNVIRDFAGGYEVTHSAPFWFVDKAGKVRAIMNADATPDDIVADARMLLRE